MIVGIINGYYRSGTTIWQRIAEELLNVVTVHEPTGPSAGFDLFGKGHPHDWDVFKGYMQVKEATFTWLKRWNAIRPRGVVTAEDAWWLMEPFHRIKEPTIVKCANVLEVQKLSDKVDWLINIKRYPPATAYAHVEFYPPAIQPRILDSLSFNYAFFVDDCYTVLSRLRDSPLEYPTVLQKLCFNLKTFYELTPPTHRFEKPRKIARTMGVSWSEAKEFIDEKKLNPSLPKWFMKRWKNAKSV